MAQSPQYGNCSRFDPLFPCHWEVFLIARILVRFDTNSVDQRGMQARRDVNSGETIFSVPFELFMTEDTALKSRLKPIFEARPEIDRDDRLALHLICERALAQDSFWAPYLPLLPTEYSHTLFFSKEEMGFLQG